MTAAMRGFASFFVVGLGLVSCTAFGQPAAPAFEIAEVHLSTSTALTVNIPRALRGNRFDARSASMLDLVAAAYAVNTANVVGGPNWLEFVKFDIRATAPVGTAPETLNRMLQNLLADRFKLVIHHGTAPQPGFALRLGKGANQMDVSAGGASGCKTDQEPPRPPQPPGFGAICRNVTMQDFALALRGMPLGGAATGPAVDQTGLKGAWDFDLHWTARPGPAQTGGITLADAIDKQLRLSLIAESVPGDVIVIDSVNEKPTENLPAVSRLPIPKYEVAVIKRTPPDAGRSLASRANGQLEATGWTLKDLIGFAFTVSRADLIDSSQKSIDTARFDVTAKTAEGVVPAVTDMTGPMLRPLLEDRFGLKTHMEERDLPGFSLTAGKPKLKAADPSRRAGCKLITAAQPNSQGIRPRTVTCQNVTLTQFASQLGDLSGNRFQLGVVDDTGIQGTWDFSVTYVPFGAQIAGQQAATPAERVTGDQTVSAPDALDGATLDVALNEQLGLKVETRKRKMQVVVVDSVNEMPTEN